MHLPRTTIQSHIIDIRPRYAETDQGSVVHHSIYPVYFEMGRTELLRANGLAYADLEKQGIFLVVADLQVKFRNPAFYDQLLTLQTTCSKVTPARIEHQSLLKRKLDAVTVAQGFTTLACIDKSGKLQRIPDCLYPQVSGN